MATSTRKTVVRNNGNFNKGGSKTITSYNKEGNVTAVRSLRGSINNKRGGMDNQYLVTTYRPDAPSKDKPLINGRPRSSGDGGTSLLLLILFVIFLGVFWLIWRGGVWVYEKFFD